MENAPLPLTATEETLKEFIANHVKKAGKAFYEGKYTSDLDEWIREAGERAHALHMALKLRGHEPKHHRYMVENRGMPSDNPHFYMHFHPLEDLLKFLHDPHANDDPEDQTIGEEFTFAVYSKRWGREDTYRITRTELGWDVRHLMIGGPCDKGGRPFLFDNFRQDAIQYPSDLSGWLEWLWNKAADEGLPSDIVQSSLQELAEWVTTVEAHRPTGQVWQGY